MLPVFESSKITPYFEKTCSTSSQVASSGRPVINTAVFLIGSDFDFLIPFQVTTLKSQKTHLIHLLFHLPFEAGRNHFFLKN